MIPALTARNTGSGAPERWLSHAGHPAPKRRNIQIGVVDNVWLFVPFGAGVCRFFGVKKAILFSFLFTVAIESAQYITSLGTAELNDIFGNTLGGAIGSLSAITIKIKRKSA